VRLFGLEVTLAKQMMPAAVPVRSQSFLSTIFEPFSGAWQKNITPESRQNLTAFSAVYACISLIASDISKLQICLKELTDNGIWKEVERNSPIGNVLRKPNSYQNRIQFLSYWITSKLLYGNAYILLGRDARRVVTSMYPLDPRLVTPLVTQEGDVYYRLNQDTLSGLELPITVPASEIIHDRDICLFHPLVGVSPIYACGASATQGIRIQANSAAFFENMSRPSGQLTAPGPISGTTADRLKAEFEKNFQGGKLGKLLVAGDGLKYEPMTIPANDAQLIEQLKWTVEDVARCFHVPLYKLGGAAPIATGNTAVLNQDYYTQTLQSPIESVELCLDEGLGISAVKNRVYGVELDLDGLFRMDPTARADVNQKNVSAGILAPNEARMQLNLPPVTGGDTPYLQQQNWSLSALDRRDSTEPVALPATTTPQPAPIPAPTPAKGFDMDELRQLFEAEDA
jgi:HK97 family phage portal protein